MHQFISAPDDVLALTVSHKITGDDLTAAMDRLDHVMGAHQTVHVFVEAHSIEGLELTSLPSYTARAMSLLGQLNRFGRVAVVADQAWLRFGTRLESMVLPFITYRVYEPEQREEALAWVSHGTEPGSA